ncbi:MAG: energy transducer TonB, partial [Kofleriaceae bacterium]|nr:energy transducer TonB [Kofleriaceae bacterium]
GQVVEVLAPDVEMTPDNARFVSEYNTKVARETVARGTTEKMVAKPAAKELEATDTPEPLFEDPTPAGPEPSAVATSEAKPARVGPGAGGRVSASPLLAMRATEYRPEHKAGEVDGSDALADNGLASKLGDHGQASSGQDAQEGREAVAAGMGGGGSPLNLRPSQEMLERAMGGGSVDKIDGVESGDTTALNSKKWKFASFFNRMKRQVAQNWHPAGVFARRDPSGKVYGVKNRETVLELYLKPDGSLDRYVILQSSGVDFLDDEAGAAFERAQPFPNPPSGLLDQSSQRIRFSFGFHFRVGSRQESWRVFRQN